jgi:hypothetical protein
VNIVFMGGEVPSHRTLLLGVGVTDIHINYWRLKKRGLPKTKDYILADRFPDGVRIYVDGGAAQADEARMTMRELEDYAAEYQDWVILNAERLTAATEFDSRILGSQWINEQRRTFWEELGDDRFWPVWHSELGHASLLNLSEMYPHVAIPGDAIEDDTSLAARTRAMASRFDTSFHGLGIAKPDNLRSIPFETASTLSWVSPMMRGETIVWDGSKLVRYQKKMKDQARPRYKAVIDKAGLDFEKILNDDPNEVTRLAIWSYLQLEQAVDRKRPDLTVINGGDKPLLSDSKHVMDGPGNAETQGLPPDNRELDTRKVVAPSVTPRDPSEMRTLPVMGVTARLITDYDEEGREYLREAPLLTSTGSSLRQCDTCFVATNCPAYKESSTCAFSLPVEVKTKDQLKSLLNAIIEMQGSRVAFARFAEELNGGYPDPNTGQEIDRLFKIVKQLKELEENREFIRITAERQGGAGVLSALFGDRAASLNQLPNGGLSESQTTRIISDSLD